MIRNTARLLTVTAGGVVARFGPFLPGDVWRLIWIGNIQIGQNIIITLSAVAAGASPGGVVICDALAVTQFGGSAFVELPVWHRFDSTALYAYVKLAHGVGVDYDAAVFLGVAPGWSGTAPGTSGKKIPTQTPLSKQPASLSPTDVLIKG